MKTRILILMMGLIGFNFSVTAQEEYDCEQSYIIFNSALKAKDYPRAYAFWQKLVSGTCDDKVKEKTTIIANGAYVLGKLTKGVDAETKRRRIDSIYFAYNKGFELGIRSPKDVQALGIAYAKYDLAAKPQEIHDLLDESIKALGKGSKSSALRSYFASCLHLFNAGKMDKGGIVKEYLRLSPIAKANSAKNAGNAKLEKRWKDTEGMMLQMASPFLTCDVITEIYKPKVEADPTNKELLNEAFNLLDGAKCETNDVSFDFYLTVLDNMLKGDPSVKGYYGKAKLELAKDKKKEADESLEQAFNLCNDTCELKLEIIKAGTGAANSSKWYDRWMSADPNAGQPWLRKANQVANKVNDFKVDPNLTIRQLCNAKAIEYCEKAKSLDSSVASAANSAIEAYKKGLPSCNELFQLSLKSGDSYTLGGGVGSVTVMCK